MQFEDFNPLRERLPSIRNLPLIRGTRRWAFPEVQLVSSRLLKELSNPNISYEKVDDILKTVDLGKMPYCSIIDSAVRHNTPLHVALSNPFCSTDIIRLLLQRGASILGINARLQTPLHIALENHVFNYEVISLFLDANNSPSGIIPVRLSDRDGNTPLHVALANLNCELRVIEILINKGAIPTRRNFKLLSPLDLFLKNPSCKLEILKFLLDSGAHVTDRDSDFNPVHIHLKNPNCRVEIISELINRGASIEGINTHHRNVIHMAVLNPNCYEVLLELLERGDYDINAKDFHENTALHYAVSVEGADIRVVSLLLKLGASVHSRNWKEEIPLKFALKPKIYNLKIIQMLLHAGSSVCELDQFNTSPLGSMLQRYVRDPMGHRLSIELLIMYAAKKYFEDYDRYHLFRYNESLCTSFCPDFNCGDYSHLSSTIEGCFRELCRMSQHLLINYLTVYDIMFSTKKVNADLTDYFLRNLYVNNYCIYQDILIDRLDKSYMIIILSRLGFYSRIESSEIQIKKVVLDEDCVHIIAKYLNCSDLFNLTVAYYQPILSVFNKISSVKRQNEDLILPKKTKIIKF